MLLLTYSPSNLLPPTHLHTSSFRFFYFSSSHSLLSSPPPLSLFRLHTLTFVSIHFPHTVPCPLPSTQPFPSTSFFLVFFNPLTAVSVCSLSSLHPINLSHLNPLLHFFPIPLPDLLFFYFPLFYSLFSSPPYSYICLHSYSSSRSVLHSVHAFFLSFLPSYHCLSSFISASD